METPTSRKIKAHEKADLTKKSNNALIVFLKVPEVGKVKTRIGNVLGHEEAVEIYRKLLNKTMTTLSHLTIDKLLFFDPKPFSLPEWPEQIIFKHVQEGENLGDRMHHSFQVALQKADRAVIVGTDCPYLTPELIEQAFDQLASHDFVLGPSPDGGYYLLGMKEPCANVFQDIPWSTDQVSKLTIERINTQNKSWFELPTLADIDHPEDWEAYLESI